MHETNGTVKLRLIKEVRGYIDGRRAFTIKGRLAPTLLNLMQAGMGGYMFNEQMAPFSSTDVSRLRKIMVIETIRWNGLDGRTRFHVRYVLRSQITITEIKLTEMFRYVA